MPPIITLLTGLAVFALTGILFWRALPRDGKYQRLMGTALEPYVAVVFTAGVALGFAMVLTSALELLGR